MDIIDKQFKIKKFFKLIYRGIEEEEYIRVFQDNKDYKKVSFFNDVDDLVQFSTSKYTNYNNTYFTLATTHGEGGASENLEYRYCLAFDFDKKDYQPGFNHKDILNRFRDAKIHYHALIDSGNGYHVYIMINRTDDLQKVQKVQEALCDKLGADKNAIKSTQILRVPYTFNVKNKPKMVTIIHLEDRHSDLFKPYDIDFLYDKNCKRSEVKTDAKTTTYVLNNTNIPKCIRRILDNGSEEGNRYKDLQNIVVALRNTNKPLSQIKEVCREWAIKSQFDDNLTYRIEHIYENKHNLELECKECSEFKKCYDSVASDFEYKEDEKLIEVTEKEISKLKKVNRRGAKVMKSNDLLVYSVLKLHNDGLTKEEIIKELTYKSRRKKIETVALSDKTLRDTLKSLEENGFVEVKTLAKGKKLYQIIHTTSTINMTFNISYSATMECIKGNISTEEYKLYCYMRYLHNKEQREEPKALKGNLFQINQVDLAEHFGVTQGRISQMIDNLLDEKLLSIWYRQESKNNGFIFNIYRLNY